MPSFPERAIAREGGLRDSVGFAGPGAVRALFEQESRIAGERFCCGHSAAHEDATA